jgi:hypothetical protein
MIRRIIAPTIQMVTMPISGMRAASRPCLERDLLQAELGEALGISFQQAKSTRWVGIALPSGGSLKSADF